jgi:hypothetical protein
MFKRIFYAVLGTIAILVVINPNVTDGVTDKELEALCDDIISNGYELNSYMLTLNGVDATMEQKEDIRRFLAQPKTYSELSEAFGGPEIMDSALDFEASDLAKYTVYECISDLRGVFPKPKKLF